MRISHDVVPRHRRQRAASHAFGRGIVVVAHPNRSDEISRVTDEPAIAPIVGGAGLAAGRYAVELRAAAGAVLYHRVLHLDHVKRDLRGDHLPWFRTVTVEAPHQLAGIGTNLEGGVRRDGAAEIGKSGVRDGVLDNGDSVGSDRQRGRIRQRRVYAEIARGLYDHGAAELGISLAE